MVFSEGALTVGGLGVITIIINKLKFFIKKNGDWTCGCGCQDDPLVIDEEEIEVKTVDLGKVKVLYAVSRSAMD